MKNKMPDVIADIRKKDSAFWEKTKATHSLALFKNAALKVPAYKDFLHKQGFKPEKIKRAIDLEQLPAIDKKNYLTKYPLSKLSEDGHLNKPLVFTSTSGSTGDPFYFHRSFELDWQASIIHELFYLHGHYKKNEPVLVIVCFGMGIWIGGLITYQAFHLTQERGHNFSLITPGINKMEIFKLLKSLGKSYKHIVIAGYPPFVKDLLDEGPSHDIRWDEYGIRLLFAAETFTEEFRDYSLKVIHSKNTFLDSMNIYGTADLGAMAFETPISILIRRLAGKNPALFEAVFKKIHKTPTLCQYIPSFISFEAEGNNLFVYGKNSMPLVKYALGDHGGVYSFSQMQQKFTDIGIDLKAEAKKVGILDYWYELPFVYVYELDDFSTNVYGLQVYPEPIKQALLKKPISSYVTGKFTMETKFDNKQNQYLLLHIELRKNQTANVPAMMKKVMVNAIVEQLELKNSEYRELHRFIGSRALPVLQFWPAEDPNYFKIGSKQKWVKKN